MNFLSMYDNCAFDGCRRLSNKPSQDVAEWKQLPLWLWETHNDVNSRLMNERLEQNDEVPPNAQESQQSQWPPSFACPKCWRLDRSWDEDEVYDNLRRIYYVGSPSYISISEQGVLLTHWKLCAAVLALCALLVRMTGTKSLKHKI